jgi:electron transfer flavoprotein alpha subunit
LNNATDSTDVIVVVEEGAEVLNRGLLAEGGRIAELLAGKLFAVSGDAFALSIPFRLMLFAHTDRGSELAPLVARGFDSAAVTDCVDIRFRKGTLYYARHVFGGQFEQEVSFAGLPEFASLRVESLEACAGAFSESLQFEEVRLPIPEAGAAKRTIRTIPPDFKTVDIRYAKRVLDIGAGCDQTALLSLAEELARLLEASIGTTRLVVDNGRIPKTRMIGRTGKSTSPEFTLALGVSGSPNHVAGIRQSGRIFSVNSDARAPIFGVSDAGFICDLNALLPKLIDRVKQHREISGENE